MQLGRLVHQGQRDSLVLWDKMGRVVPQDCKVHQDHKVELDNPELQDNQGHKDRKVHKDPRVIKVTMDNQGQMEQLVALVQVDHQVLQVPMEYRALQGLKVHREIQDHKGLSGHRDRMDK